MKSITALLTCFLAVQLRKSLEKVKVELAQAESEFDEVSHANLDHVEEWSALAKECDESSDKTKYLIYRMTKNCGADVVFFLAEYFILPVRLEPSKNQVLTSLIQEAISGRRTHAQRVESIWREAEENPMDEDERNNNQGDKHVTDPDAPPYLRLINGALLLQELRYVQIHSIMSP